MLATDTQQRQGPIKKQNIGHLVPTLPFSRKKKSFSLSYFYLMCHFVKRAHVEHLWT